VIDDAACDADLYKIVGWHKLDPRLKSPPLQIGDRVIKDNLGKAEALREAVLECFSDTNDLDYDLLDGWLAEEPTLL
jgi:hypothetical protein